MDLLFIKVLIVLILGIFIGYGISTFKISLTWEIVLSFIAAVLLSVLIVL